MSIQYDTWITDIYSENLLKPSTPVFCHIPGLFLSRDFGQRVGHVTMNTKFTYSNWIFYLHALHSFSFGDKWCAPCIKMVIFNTHTRTYVYIYTYMYYYFFIFDSFLYLHTPHKSWLNSTVFDYKCIIRKFPWLYKTEKHSSTPCFVVKITFSYFCMYLYSPRKDKTYVLMKIGTVMRLIILSIDSGIVCAKKTTMPN